MAVNSNDGIYYRKMMRIRKIISNKQKHIVYESIICLRNLIDSSDKESRIFFFVFHAYHDERDTRISSLFNRKYFLLIELFNIVII